MLSEKQFLLETAEGYHADVKNCYLVDPASSHMLVSKTKPCMSKYELSIVKPRMAHYNSHSLLDIFLYMDNCGNSTANTRSKTPTSGGVR
jgi:hypothetical protein